MLKRRVDEGEQLIVVVSAMGKTTDLLMEKVQSLTTTPEIKNLPYC